MMDSASVSGQSPLGLTIATCPSPVSDPSILENKWRSICSPALPAIIKKCQYSSTGLQHLEIKDEAYDYVSNLMLHVVRVLMSSLPNTLPELERSVSLEMIPLEQIHDLVKILFPSYEKEVNQKSQKKLLQSSTPAFSFSDVHGVLKLMTGRKQVDLQLTIFVVTALEFIASEVFKVTSKYVFSLRQGYVGKEDISVAINANKQLLTLFSPPEMNANVVPDVTTREFTHNSYEDAAKALVEEEKAFLRDVRLINKVFKSAFEQLLPKKSVEDDNTNSLPASPTSTTPDTRSGQWSVPSSPTHKTPLKITQDDIKCIFSVIGDIEETSSNLLCGIEDALEAMTSADGTSADRQPKSGIESIGSCFEDVAEALEFEVFETLAQEVFTDKHQLSNSSKRLMTLLADNTICSSLKTGGNGFVPAIRYVLPKFLNGVVLHAFTYFEYIEVLRKLSPSEEDRESFAQAEGLLNVLKKTLSEATPLKPRFGEHFLRLTRPRFTTPPLDIIPEVLRLDTTINSHIQEFLHEGKLLKVSKHGRWSERHAFLFEGLIVLCKQVKPGDLKIKEKLSFKHKEYRLEVLDFSDSINDDNDSCTSTSSSLHTTTNNVVGQIQQQIKLISLSSLGTSTTSLASTITQSNIPSTVLPGGVNLPLKDAFCIRHTNENSTQNEILLRSINPEDKVTWMSHLVFISTKSFLERRLDTAIDEEERKNPLQMPDVSVYPFSVPDSEENIIFDKEENRSPVPLIKGATLIKLVERLTYHKHADPLLLKVFLTTFRSFCTPNELLQLLVQRFEIPDITSKKRDDIKRYENSFVSPIQIRVLNVIRHWVDHHYYDFASDPTLLDRTTEFLKNIVAKKTKIKKWLDSILRSIAKKRDFGQATLPEHFTFNGEPPEFEMGLARNPCEFNILTIHPIEFARQLTILEFDLYRRVQPSELVGWTKKDKEQKAPNLLKIIALSNNITYWYMEQIVEAANFDERVAIYSRIIEIMMVLYELNNFNGVLEVVSAMESSGVHRLDHTIKAIPGQLKKAYDDACSLSKDHHVKYRELLRSINPPCVPFIGMSLTNIVHIEEGNPDHLTTSNNISLINFAKRRRVAQIIFEIQQYQNTPYCLKVHHDIRNFIENLNPLRNEDFLAEFNSGNDVSTSDTMQPNGPYDDKEIRLAFEAYLHRKTLIVEPRESRAPSKFERKWPSLSLKSPGIKPSTGSVTLSRTTKTPKTPAPVTNESGSSVTPVTGSGQSTPILSCQSNHTVFAPVLLGSSGSSSLSNEPPPLPPRTIKFGLQRSSESDSPPPLPPRSFRSSSTASSSGRLSTILSSSNVSTSTSNNHVPSHRHFHLHNHNRHPHHHTMHFPSSIPFTRNHSFSGCTNSLTNQPPSIPPLAPAPAARRHSSAVANNAAGNNNNNNANNNINNNNINVANNNNINTTCATLSQVASSGTSPITTTAVASGVTCSAAATASTVNNMRCNSSASTITSIRPTTISPSQLDISQSPSSSSLPMSSSSPLVTSSSVPASIITPQLPPRTYRTKN